MPVTVARKPLGARLNGPSPGLDRFRGSPERPAQAVGVGSRASDSFAVQRPSWLRPGSADTTFALHGSPAGFAPGEQAERDESEGYQDEEDWSERGVREGAHTSVDAFGFGRGEPRR
jgi:hypothetical protein